MENKIKTKLNILEDGKTLERVTTMEFKDLGYNAENTKKQTFLDRDKFVKEIEATENRIMAVTEMLDKNDVFLKEIEKEYKDVWNSNKYKLFIKNFEELSAAKKEQEKYNEKVNLQKDFKEENKNNKEVLVKYKEILEKWK